MKETRSDGAARRQRDKRSTVSLAKHTHEACKALTRLLHAASNLVDNRKPNRMNPDPSITRGIGFVYSVHPAHHGFDGSTTKLIAEYIQADLLVRIVEGIDGLSNSLNRATV